MIKNKKEAVKKTIKDILEVSGIIIMAIIIVTVLVVGMIHNVKYIEEQFRWIFPVSIVGSVFLFLIISFLCAVIKFDYEDYQVSQIIENLEDEILLETNKNIEICELHRDDVFRILNAELDEEIVHIKNRIKGQIKDYIKNEDKKYIYSSYKKYGRSF